MIEMLMTRQLHSALPLLPPSAASGLLMGLIKVKGMLTSA